MEIVFTHNNMDFDSLAAQYAVTKLWPSARMLPGYPLVGNVRQFLSLYRDTLPISQLKYLDLDHVSKIFIVDCQHIDRLDDTARKLIIEQGRSYTIFDHHQMDPQGLGPGAQPDSIIQPVGSTTTLLVEQIKKRKVKLTPFEATLLLIGIYEDTGCLTYGGTQSTDAECVAYLLRQGADLTRVNDYLHPKMSDRQIELLEKLIHNSKSLHVSGSKIVIAQGSLPDYLDGLATLTRKLVEIEAADAAISVVRMRDRIHLVGRSDTPAVDVRALLREFGGDGHPGAGSAVVKEDSVSAVVSRVEQVLKSQVRPETIAEEFMTSPVRTIKPRTTMEEAGRIMLRYGLDGLVVVERGEVAGVVSRRDIDQATHHKLGHAPVQGFMSRPVITIAPTTTLSEIQRIMVHEDIGRLPVLDEGGQLVGIVSRREVLNTLYGGAEGGEESYAAAAHPDGQPLLLTDWLKSLDTETLWLWEQLGMVAARLGMVAYAVGGCVRDLLLKRANFDLDFVIEGSSIELGQALELTFPSRLQMVAKHDRFQTATLEYHAAQKREVDLSTARTEFYEFPAALPTVEASSLRQDLFRRDFTINALAICLNPGRFGELIDYFGGLKDIEGKTIRILHPFSFIEDPTRIVRAARFAARLGFKLDAKTREQAERAINMGIFDDLGGVRMRTELKLILESRERMRALDLLGELGGRLGYLDAKLEYGPRVRRLLRLAERLLSRYSVPSDWVVYLALLLSQLEPATPTAVLSRLHLSNEQKEQIEKGVNLPNQLALVDDKMKPSQIYSLLHGLSDQSLAIAACLAKPGSPLRRMIKLYLDELKHVEVAIGGADLLRMGFPQGPEIGRVLSELTEAKLDGRVDSLQDEVTFVRDWAQNLRH